MMNATSAEAGAIPLLTIAIPTYNRSGTLSALLEMLLPQVAAHADVELLVANNASPDDTLSVLKEFEQRFAAAGANLHVQSHAINIGSDANFVWLYHHARGRYFWLCSDDDLILPGSIDEVVAQLIASAPDLVYVTSYGFREDWQAERRGDPLGRMVHTVHSARQFARVVNVMFTFISGIIVNKARLESIPHEDPSAYLGTNLTQLSWTLPLLADMRCGVVLWNRPLAGRQGHSAGYSIGDVFAARLSENCIRLLPNHPEIVRQILNPAVRKWFPSAILEARNSRNQTLSLDTADVPVRRVFGRNWRYWLFLWPVFKLPLPLANLWVKAGGFVNKFIYIAHLPGFWRKRT
jgi:glycosyltransferase involved in cell wall biosynthesis